MERLAVSMDERVRVMREYWAIFYEDAGGMQELREGRYESLQSYLLVHAQPEAKMMRKPMFQDNVIINGHDQVHANKMSWNL